MARFCHEAYVTCTRHCNYWAIFPPCCVSVFQVLGDVAGQGHLYNKTGMTFRPYYRPNLLSFNQITTFGGQISGFGIKCMESKI